MNIDGGPRHVHIRSALFEMTLTANKGQRSGTVLWAERSCDVSFVVKPG